MMAEQFMYMNQLRMSRESSRNSEWSVLDAERCNNCGNEFLHGGVPAKFCRYCGAARVLAVQSPQHLKRQSSRQALLMVPDELPKHVVQQDREEGMPVICVIPESGTYQIMMWGKLRAERTYSEFQQLQREIELTVGHGGGVPSVIERKRDLITRSRRDPRVMIERQHKFQLLMQWLVAYSLSVYDYQEDFISGRFRCFLRATPREYDRMLPNPNPNPKPNSNPKLEPKPDSDCKTNLKTHPKT